MRSENASSSDADIRQVAESMWEGLDPDHKQVSSFFELISDITNLYTIQYSTLSNLQNYLDRVEEQKREYLKQLLEWRTRNSLPPLNPEVCFSTNQFRARAEYTVRYTQHFHSYFLFLSNFYGLFSQRPILCTRRGCTEPAAENPRWDHEFCSDQCCLAFTRYSFWISIYFLSQIINSKFKLFFEHIF